MNFVEHLKRQKDWSKKTFGPGTRLEAVLDHISKEIDEIKAKPHDLEEWIDLILLVCDGAWRQGYAPKEIARVLAMKLEKNMQREWPDWRTAPADKAIEHVRTGD